MPHQPTWERPVQIPSRGIALHGDLCIPDRPLGVVLFAHGTGSGRQSPRNQMVARRLQRSGFITLLLDLLTPGEELAEAQTGKRNDGIQRLAERLAHATDWLRRDSLTAGLPVGYFGASTGAAAALIAAAIRPHVRAIVSRGGRPDLADRVLERVHVPALFIVGELDVGVLQLNESARARMRCQTSVVTVTNAHHLFEEVGALETVADLAADWFELHLIASTASPTHHHRADG